ncbi:hepatitis A virus cellular receptor 1 homolog isoform X2 [Parambassis ranga]|uniref:Hepatitis A virus cellular receptor 1 homolog isoform X2 n=1 Tax=Parambassis ranga TaxID=210632 RepID=A0A6P7JLG8_9TELE|nr:hepatitis A virus cellular receptor 1 homolog isoform X2 [Parambassis ranga]
MMLTVLLPALLTVCVCDSRTVTGQTGQSATLPCTYDVKTDGALHVCWGRGQIPIRGCSQQLIATDGRQVTQSLSDRFQLLGQLDRGNVSLTIHNITEADAGQYGCRAEVPGWFNDAKHQVELVVLRAPHTTPWTPPATPPATPAGTTATSQTAGHMTSTQTLRTSRSSGIKSAEDSGTLTAVLVCVLLGLVVLLAVAGLFIILRRRNLRTTAQQQVGTSVMFTSTSSTLHLHQAVDNIYQIEGDGTEGDYESCP